jgi:maltooligosyltrehalose trehalohydrolase
VSGPAEGRVEWRPSLGAWLEPEGVRFRVWAPERRSVELVLEGDGSRRVEPRLERDGEGYWQGFVPGLGSGALYRYLLDGEGPFPDPASRRQPRGVHGRSQVVDPAGFSWRNPAWPGLALEDTILYELHVGTFTRAGTFTAAAERLPEIRDLGVSAVELMPVAAFPGRRNWGYDGVDLFAPASAYGEPDDLRRLVDRAHSLGLGVLLDVVYNHLGPDGAFLGSFSPFYFSRTHETPWGAAINLDGERSGPVRHFLIENALHWIHEYRFDGLRLDACHALVDDSSRHLLAEMQARVRDSARPRRVLMIAEDSRNLVQLVQPESEGGWGLDAVWADDLHHQLRVALAGDRDGYYADFTGSLEDTARTLADGWFYQGQHSRHTGGPRGTDPRSVPPRRFVVCLQNHDQVGNRALGERLHHQIDEASWRAVSTLLLLAPQTPLLFMGQEWGATSPFLYFTDHEPELGRLVTEGRRKEFADFAAFASPAARAGIPDPQSERTFRRSRLAWRERTRDLHTPTLRLYKALLALRRDLGLGQLERRDYRVEGRDGELVLEVDRPDRPRVLVVVRLGGAGVLEGGQEGGTSASGDSWRVVLTTEDVPFTSDPQPPTVGGGSPLPRVAFRRAGAVVLSRA